MSRTWRLGVGFGLLLTGLAAAPALAACAPDGTGHPAESFIFAQIQDPATCVEYLTSACEAVLISPTVAITTGDCVVSWTVNTGFNITAWWISNNPDDNIDCGTADRVDSWHLHPNYDPANPESPFNIGVIVLAAASTHPYASLPAAGALDLLPHDQALDAVAYVDNGGPIDPLSRFVGTAALGKTTQYTFKLRKAAGCTPDTAGSGVFLPGGQDLMGINLDSRGTQLRLDSPEVRDFLDDFVTLP
jgi:hypothetical protein